MLNRSETSRKLIIFDMEHTLLQNSFIDVCAEQFKFQQALSLLRQIDNNPESLTRRTAWFLRDQKKSVLLEIASALPLVPESTEVVQELKARDYVVGIISNSYHLVTGIIGKKIGADFELSNELQCMGNHVTGEVTISSYFHHSPTSACRHSICKTNAMQHISKAYHSRFDDCIVVGGNDEDACMLEHAGLGIAFPDASELAKKAAGRRVEEDAFNELLTLVP